MGLARGLPGGIAREPGQGAGADSRLRTSMFTAFVGKDFGTC